MPRNMSGALQSALSAGIIWPAIFAEIHFSTGPVYIWSGYGPITWSGQTWVGAGDLGSISVIEGGSNVEARGITLTLSGINSSIVLDCLNQFQQGLPAIISLGTFTDSTRTTLVVDPVSAWTGRMDQASIEIGAESSSITLMLETRLLEMNVAVDRRYTNDDQQLRAPGDLGFSFVQGQINEILYWGRTPFQSFSQ